MIKLFRYLKPYWVFVAITVTLVLAQSLMDLYLPDLMSDIVDVGVTTGDTAYILRMGGLMLLVTLVNMGATVLRSYTSARAATSFGRDMRNAIFEKVQHLDLDSFDKLGTASLITRTTNDVMQVQGATDMMMRMMISSPMMGIGGIVMALKTNVKLSTVIAVGVPILLIVTIFRMIKTTPLFRQMQYRLDKVNRTMRENMTGMRVIRAFNRQKQEEERFNEANYELTDLSIRVQRMMAMLMPAGMLVMNLTVIVLLLFGSRFIDEGTMLTGDLIAFIQYSSMIMFSFQMMSGMFNMLPRAAAAAKRVNEVLEMESIVDDPAAPQDIDPEKRGMVEFKNVSFAYAGAQNNVLSGISFVARPGKTTAILGGTGSGKSTLVQLIPRFYDASEGQILVGGVDVRNQDQKKLRGQIGYVAQKSVLFSGSVGYNFFFGKDDATLADMREAASIAQADDFIENLPYGYDSLVAQNGQNFSGGQRQRLSIARALVRKPDIFIFDDSFSALDFKTDAKLRAAMKENLADATVIIVAQRIATVMDADNIIVLDEGRIVGSGTHSELLQNCEEYREIVYSQLDEKEVSA